MLNDLGTYVAQGSVFRVEAAEPLAAELRRCLRDLRATTDSRPPTQTLTVRHIDGRWTVAWGEHHRYRGDEADMALYDALIAINVHAARVAVEAGRAVLHGGAVEVHGGAVVFVGHSGAGKSTFTTAMTRAGHAFLADEVVAIDQTHDDMVVEPFHRPIGLRAGGAKMLSIEIPDGPYERIYPYRVGGRDETENRTESGVDGVLGGRTPLRLVVMLKRSDSGLAQLGSIRPARALFELANQTLGATDLEREMFCRLDALVRRVPIVELQYSNVIDAIPMIERAVADDLDKQ